MHPLRSRVRLALAAATCALALGAPAALAHNLSTIDPNAVSPGHVLLNPPGSSPGSALIAWTTAPTTAGDAAIPTVCVVALRDGVCHSPVHLHMPDAPPNDEVETGLAVNGLFPQTGPDGSIVVLGPRDGRDVLRWTSTDGGKTFGEATSIAGANPERLVAPDDAVQVAGSTLIGITGSTTLGVGAFVSGTDDPGAGLTFANPGDSVASSSTALDAAGRPVVAYYNLGDSPSGGNSTVSFFRYGADDTTPAGLTTAANWTGPAQVSTGYEPLLAGGAAGLFLVTEDTAPGAGVPTLVHVRKDDGTAFGAPIATLSSDGSSDLFEGGAAAQSPSGRLAVLWPGRRSADDSGVLRLYTSTNGGGSFSETDVGTFGGGWAPDRNAQLALGDDGQGIATYRDADGLHVADLAPTNPPPPHTGSTGTVTISAGGNALTLRSPRGCARPGKFTAELLVHKAKGRRQLRVRKVTFTFDNRVRKVRTHRPFRARFTIAGAAGTIHTLNVRVVMRGKGGLRVTRTLVTKFGTC